MKYFKMLGLAAVAAVTTMAFVGVGSASATVICKTEPVKGVCPEGWIYPTGTGGDASLTGTGFIETLGGTVLDTCTGGTVSSTLTDGGSITTTVKGVSSELTWVGCTKTTDTIANGSSELHWIHGTNNGTLTTFNTEVTINTIFGSCVYGVPGAGLDMGTTVGGTPGSLEINTTIPKLGGNAACPAETRFTANYVATSPTNAWVAER